MKPYVSSTGSPMYYAARIAKERHPDAKIVFIGPCVAKRKEARRDECVDYILMIGYQSIDDRHESVARRCHHHEN